MEHFRRGVEFGMASFQRCHSMSCQMAESTHPEAQKAGTQRKEKPRRAKCSHPAEMPVIPEQAMEFLSRTWSPSSSDLFQILSPCNLGASPDDCQHEADEMGGDEEGAHGGRRMDAVRVTGAGNTQLFNETWRVVAGGKRGSSQRKRRPMQPSWLNMGAVLRGYFLGGVAVAGGGRRSRRRDELRLSTAQAHAAVSVAQLAAAIAGIVSACDLEVRPAAAAAAIAGDRKMSTVLTSAAALVATVCAEAAEAAGANWSRVTSAVKTGLDSRSSAELLTLTATAATCLRGAAALKLRSAVSSSSVMSISASIQKGATLRVCLPCGRVRLREVAIIPQRDKVALRLGKKRLRGAFTTYEDHEVLAVVESGGGEAVVDGRGFFPAALSTSAGTVQLLLEDQTNCKVWKASIDGMLSQQINPKH